MHHKAFEGIFVETPFKRVFATGIHSQPSTRQIAVPVVRKIFPCQETQGLQQPDRLKFPSRNKLSITA